MHELTIANSLVELASAHAADNGAIRVKAISVRMGVLCGIGRSLYFCFEPASRGTACEGASLRIEEVPLRVRCEHCDDVKTPKALYNFRCPDCGYPTPGVVSGREMELVSIELETADETALVERRAETHRAGSAP
jgi:hydrogenase nickel incorporation protein HypA/HybF